MAQGVRDAGAVADACPVADGGEGTLEVMLAARGGQRIEAEAHDPLRRPLRAELGLLGDGETAVVEVAAASGLPLLAPEERDPERADTYGTGELIAAAIEAGAGTVLVAAGGSATTDGGRGAIEALRQRGVDDGSRLRGGVRLEIVCDVEIPYEDAARVFAPQKGADPAAVERLTARLEEFAASLPNDPSGVPMTGCAGGLSGGLWAAFGARLRPGARFVLEQVGFDARLAAADAAIAGEGQIDDQSLRGKIVGTIAEACHQAGKPLHVIAGLNTLDPDAADAAHIASIAEASTLEEIAAATRRLLAESSPA
ncbi:MAG: glycerate 2-kinase [Solirubrobacterales bacterium]|nr:glycerate 2-kinase [Solirubrobacterales bacterium]